MAARPFWNEINKARSQKTSPNFPTLRHGDVVAKDDQQKASLFGSILKQTFSASFQVNDFDSDHYNLTESSNYENFSDEFPPITMLELNKTIKKLRNKCTPGVDSIHNLFLKKLPFSYRIILLTLINLSIKTGLPKSWKIAKITMIPKSVSKSKDPGDYRPISLTSCLVKLAERVVKT